MKIGIVSDIHAAPQALRRALEDMPSVDRILCAGDAISEYQFCADTVTLLQQAKAQCIQGNHEWVLFGGRNPQYLQKCRDTFAREALDALATAPDSLSFEAEGARIFMVHASPWQPFDNSSRFVLIFLYDLCRKALSKPISCPRSRLECHLHSENRSEAWSLQLWVSIGVELRPR